MVSGITQAMHNTGETSQAYNSVEHIMRDVNKGWQIRNIHGNEASIFVIQVYTHIGRNRYYGTYRKPKGQLWKVGVGIYLVIIQTAFIGYKKVWGKLSFWGATVITSMGSAVSWIGQDQVSQIWGAKASVGVVI